MSNRRVLVVERDAVIALDLVESLELAGYEVRCVARSAEALEKAREFRPALAIVDADVAGPLDLLALHEQQRCSLVYLTSRSCWPRQAWLASSLPLFFLKKPFSASEFMTTAAAAIAAHSAEGLALPVKAAHGRSCSPARGAAPAPLTA